VQLQDGLHELLRGRAQAGIGCGLDVPYAALDQLEAPLEVFVA
jgi:hypothetical protein